jgi:hypothetical protein
LGSATDLDDSIGTSSKSVQFSGHDLDFELFISFLSISFGKLHSYKNAKWAVKFPLTESEVEKNVCKFT